MELLVYLTMFVLVFCAMALAAGLLLRALAGALILVLIGLQVGWASLMAIFRALGWCIGARLARARLALARG